MIGTMDARAPRYERDHDVCSRSAEYRKPQKDRAGEAKKRPCLICGKKFFSAWCGERVCSKCKSTSAWRVGVR
jgi:hypothetical protein